MAASLAGLCRSAARLRPRLYSARAGKGRTGQADWKKVGRTAQARVEAELLEQRRLEGRPAPLSLNHNLTQLFSFFPLWPDRLAETLLQHPDLLNIQATKLIEFITVLVESGNYEVMTQEEALLCLARCPALLRQDITKFSANLANLFGLTGPLDLPWNVVLVAAPGTLLLPATRVAHTAAQLAGRMDQQWVRDCVGNNPLLLQLDWDEVEPLLDFLQHTMHVSAYRVAMTPHSLELPLATLQLRYRFLQAPGHYHHPEPQPRSARPAEASPALHLITDTDDTRFVHKCCPGLSLEEFNVFQSLVLVEQSQDCEEEDWEEEEDDPDGDNNAYTREVQRRKQDKAKKKKY